MRADEGSRQPARLPQDERPVVVEVAAATRTRHVIQHGLRFVDDTRASLSRTQAEIDVVELNSQFCSSNPPSDWNNFVLVRRHAPVTADTSRTRCGHDRYPGSSAKSVD